MASTSWVKSGCSWHSIGFPVERGWGGSAEEPLSDHQVVILKCALTCFIVFQIDSEDAEWGQKEACLGRSVNWCEGDSRLSKTSASGHVYFIEKLSLKLHKRWQSLEGPLSYASVFVYTQKIRALFCDLFTCAHGSVLISIFISVYTLTLNLKASAPVE